MQTLITVFATLAGTVLGTVLKKRADKDGRDHDWHVKIVECGARLGACLSRHRAAMWDLESARLRAVQNDTAEQSDQAELETALAASLVTRDAITEPQMLLTILVPQLAPLASRTAQTIYAMDTVNNPAGRTQERLDERLATAKNAIEDFPAAMATLMRNLGAGLPAAPRTAGRRARAAGRFRRLAAGRGTASAPPGVGQSDVDTNLGGTR